jgi:hypothetical protein
VTVFVILFHRTTHHQDNVQPTASNGARSVQTRIRSHSSAMGWGTGTGLRATISILRVLRSLVTIRKTTSAVALDDDKPDGEDHADGHCPTDLGRARYFA